MRFRLHDTRGQYLALSEGCTCYVLFCSARLKELEDQYATEKMEHERMFAQQREVSKPSPASEIYSLEFPNCWRISSN